MLYMYMAAAPTGAGANFEGLPLLFVAVLFASAVWQLDGLSRYAPVRGDPVAAGPGGAGPCAKGPDTPYRSVPPPGEAPRPLEPVDTPGPWLAPRLEMGCHIVMCITMGYVSWRARTIKASVASRTERGRPRPGSCRSASRVGD